MADQTSDRTLLLQRLGALKNERASWMAHWAELSRYFQPRAGRFFLSDRNKGQRRHWAIHDSTGTRALRVLAAGMQAGMTSPARPWLRVITPDAELNKSHAVRVWLDDVTKLLLAIFRRSNFYGAMHQAYEELGLFGTEACVLADDFSDVVHLHQLTAGEYCVAANWRGDVTALAREFEKPVGQLVQEFGRANVSSTVRNLYDRGQLDAWVPIVHMVEPRTDRNASDLSGRGMAWRSIYFERGASPDDVLRDGGYAECPVLCSRWALTGGDIYGNSPAMEALGDVKQLQQEQLRKGQGIDFMTKPPTLLDPSLKNSEVDMMPGGQSFGTGEAKPIVVPTLRLDHLLEDIRDVRQRINSAFYVDMFLMLSSMDDPRMTATEVAARQQEKLLMLGPTSERLHDEKLTPMVERTFARAVRAGIVPPAPRELAGIPLQVEFVSMIAQAQREIGLNSMDRFVGNLGQVAAFAPTVLDKFDADAWADEYSDRLGVPAEMVVASEQVALIRANRAQAQAAAAQSQMAEQQAKTVQALGNTPVDGALAALVSGGGLVQTNDVRMR
jgi:hypothetical protein